MGQLLPNHGKCLRFSEAARVADTEAEPACGGAEQPSMAPSLTGDIPHGLPLSTGVLMLYADEESFTFMNPQGHMFADWITFSAYEEEGGTVAQIQMLIRPNDPVYELGFRLGGSRSENKFWQLTLASLAAHFGVGESVQTHVVCIDPRVQWSQFWNIWQNAAIRTVLYRVLTPLRWLLTYVSRGASMTGTR